MDTTEELKRDTGAAGALQYACAITPCDAPLVDEVSDLTPCEKCKRRVCEGHARKRSVFFLCIDCDKLERDTLTELISQPLAELVAKIRQQLMTAEEVQFALCEMEMLVSDIEGAE